MSSILTYLREQKGFALGKNTIPFMCKKYKNRNTFYM